MFEWLTLRQQGSGKRWELCIFTILPLHLSNSHTQASPSVHQTPGTTTTPPVSVTLVLMYVHVFFFMSPSSHSFSHININFLILLSFLFFLPLSLSFSLSPTSVLVYPELLSFLPLCFLSLSLFFLTTGSNYTPRSAGRVRWKVGIVCWATATRCCSHPSCTDQ